MIVTSTDGKVNVFLFVPNLVGYTRLICLLIAFMVMNGLVGDNSPVLAVSFYMASVLLDEVDGIAARKFKQESRLGAMLDIVTDRCGTICLFITLASHYPGLTMLFQVLATVDIFSHWLMTYSSLLCGNFNHKSIDKCANILLRISYSNSMFLSFMNIGHESFFLLLYILSSSSGSAIGLFGLGTWQLLACLLLPVAVLKQAFHAIQLQYAARKIAAVDSSDRERKVNQSS